MKETNHPVTNNPRACNLRGFNSSDASVLFHFTSDHEIYWFKAKGVGRRGKGDDTGEGRPETERVKGPEAKSGEDWWGGHFYCEHVYSLGIGGNKDVGLNH